MAIELKETDPAQRASRASEELICHCRQVRYDTVRTAVKDGRACTLAEVQAETTACTRCFGCRFEVESLLQHELGDRYVPTAVVRRGDERTLRDRIMGPVRAARDKMAPSLPQKMYMPILEGYAGSDVTTRLVLFNLHDERQEEGQPVDLRADLTRLDGNRQDVWRTTIAPRQTTMLNVGDMTHDGSLPDGIGLVKLILDSETVHSLRPYFHFITPNGITSTHEKRAPRRPNVIAKRKYHWIFPVTPKRRPDEAYFFLINTQAQPIEGCKLAYCDQSGHEETVDVPHLELDQGACIPLHEHFEAMRDGTASGSVRLTPSVHVAGWILRRDVETDIWRVQHL